MRSRSSRHRHNIFETENRASGKTAQPAPALECGRGKKNSFAKGEHPQMPEFALPTT